MSFNELELKRIDRTMGEPCHRRTRPDLADQLRFECEISFHSLTGLQELYWMRRDLMWHRYDPIRSTLDLAALVAVVKGDESGAFYG